MKIKQAEELVGIPSKNIRFYEEQGLISPGRAENGYREYSMENVDQLRKIKLLRKLGIPVEEIKKVFEAREDLDVCLERNLALLDKEQQSITNRRALTRSMMEKGLSLTALDSEGWLDEIERLEKEGVDFVDASKIDIHMKKKLGAFGGGIAAIILMAGVMGLMIFGMIIDPDVPKLFAAVIIGGNLIGIIAVIVAMRSRIKEIEGGEDDEALKY